jgi:hypothetical protein
MPSLIPRKRSIDAGDSSDYESDDDGDNLAPTLVARGNNGSDLDNNNDSIEECIHLRKKHLVKACIC